MLTQCHVILLLGGPCSLAVSCGLVPGLRSGKAGEVKSSTSKLLSFLLSTCREPGGGDHGSIRAGATAGRSLGFCRAAWSRGPPPPSPLPPTCIGLWLMWERKLDCVRPLHCGSCPYVSEVAYLYWILRWWRSLTNHANFTEEGFSAPAHLCQEVWGSSTGRPGGSPNAENLLLVFPTKQALDEQQPGWKEMSL